MSWYKTGQIAVTNGSRVIVGVGTNFTRFVEVGEALLGPDGKHYEIATVLSATELRLVGNYTGETASAQNYAIMPVQSYVRDLAHKAADLIDAHKSVPEEALTHAEAAEQSALRAEAAKVGLEDAKTQAESSATDAATSKTSAASSASSALASKNAAEAASSSALGYRDAAKLWADSPSGEIEPGKYSARYWAEMASNAVLGGVVYMGAWNATDGVFPSNPKRGHLYRVATSGSVGGQSYSAGDSIIYGGASWDKIDSTDQVTTVAGRVGDIALSKSDVDLGNVDNTSDANKPVSTATQTALDAKANLASPSFTGNVVAKSSPESTGIAALLGSNPGFESKAQGSGSAAGAATVAFHRPAAYAVHFGIDTDNKLKVGGWSLGANAYAIYHENNKPTKADVDLGNVDNTSDANKPVSTATQTALDAKEGTIASGTTAQYWRGDKTWRDFFTDVRAATLAGLSAATNAVVAATDTVLTAIGKLQAQVSAKFDRTGGDVDGNINFTGTARRITGDFSNDTIASRVMFQTTTPSGKTSIGVLPHGTSTVASINVFGGSDPANAPIAQLVNTGDEASLRSCATKSGAFRPLTFYTGGVEQVRIDTSGSVGIGEAPSSRYKFQAANGNWCIHSDVGQLFIESSGRVNNCWIAANITDTVNDGVYIGSGGNGIGTGTKVLKILNDTIHINPNGGLGYGVGAGGTVVQATSKSTAVTLNKPTGQVTMNNAALGAGAAVFFQLNNSLISRTDTVQVVTFGGDASYLANCVSVSTGAALIRVVNNTGGSLSDALILNFAIIKGAAS